MGFSSVNLAKIETRFVGEGEISAISRNGGGTDTIIAGIRRQA